MSDYIDRLKKTLELDDNEFTTFVKIILMHNSGNLDKKKVSAVLEKVDVHEFMRDRDFSGTTFLISAHRALDGKEQKLFRKKLLAAMTTVAQDLKDDIAKMRERSVAWYIWETTMVFALFRDKDEDYRKTIKAAYPSLRDIYWDERVMKIFEDHDHEEGGYTRSLMSIRPYADDNDLGFWENFFEARTAKVHGFAAICGIDWKEATKHIPELVAHLREPEKHHAYTLGNCLKLYLRKGKEVERGDKDKKIGITKDQATELIGLKDSLEPKDSEFMLKSLGLILKKRDLKKITG